MDKHAPDIPNDVRFEKVKWHPVAQSAQTFTPVPVVATSTPLQLCQIPSVEHLAVGVAMRLALSSLAVVMRPTLRSISQIQTTHETFSAHVVCPNTPSMPSKSSVAVATRKMKDTPRSAHSRHMCKNYTRHVQKLSTVQTQTTIHRHKKTNTHDTTCLVHFLFCPN